MQPCPLSVSPGTLCARRGALIGEGGGGEVFLWCNFNFDWDGVFSGLLIAIVLTI